MRMFREILSILRREDLLKQAMQEAQEMLSKAELMFRASVCRLMEFEETDIDIYKEDREVNRMEWEIRQKVLEHLLLGSSKEDIPAVLVLTSAVVDIERIGDYSRNIYELADISPLSMVFDEEHTKFFREIETQIFDMFGLTRDSYREGDAQKAQSVMDTHFQISERCDRLFETLASERELSAEHAVIYTLFARYLKRVSSHLKNIASSVVNPFPRMGFRASEGGEELDIG
jgi:phosphate uptake regulator